jgi:hypothetical protein
MQSKGSWKAGRRSAARFAIIKTGRPDPQLAAGRGTVGRPPRQMSGCGEPDVVTFRDKTHKNAVELCISLIFQQEISCNWLQAVL